MEDILGAVRGGSAPSPATAAAAAAPGEVSIQIEEKPSFMVDFFARVSSIKEELAAVRVDMDRFQKLKEQIANSPEAESALLVLI
jgi:hypothetical protein